MCDWLVEGVPVVHFSRKKCASLRAYRLKKWLRHFLIKTTPQRLLQGCCRLLYVLRLVYVIVRRFVLLSTVKRWASSGSATFSALLSR